MLKKTVILLVISLFFLTISFAIGTTISAVSTGTVVSDSGVMQTNMLISYSLHVDSKGYAVFIYDNAPRVSQTTPGTTSNTYPGNIGYSLGVQAYAEMGSSYATASFL